jgi:hypothetical protein
MLETLQTIRAKFNDKLDGWGNNHPSGSDAACFAWIAFWLGIYVSRYSLTGAIVEGAAIPCRPLYSLHG